jgi:hypothetical protein
MRYRDHVARDIRAGVCPFFHDFFFHPMNTFSLLLLRAKPFKAIAKAAQDIQKGFDAPRRNIQT